MASLLDTDPSYKLRWAIRMGDTGAIKNLLKGGEADPMAEGETQRRWTPLHIACWGTMKPQNDKDIIEALLLWAQKKGKDMEAKMRGAKDAVGGEMAVDLAKVRRDSIVSPPGADEGAALEEKRKYDKIVEWLEKGLPAA